jgi:hypothetical protein
MIFVLRLWLADFFISTFMAAIINGIDDTFGINFFRVVAAGAFEGHDSTGHGGGRSDNLFKRKRQTQTRLRCAGARDV